MRSIFFKLFLSFALTVFVSILISSLIAYTFSRKSLEGARNDFREKLESNIARSSTLIGEAAYAIYETRGKQAVEEYLEKIEDPLGSEIFLSIGSNIIPGNKAVPVTVKEMIIEAKSDNKLHLLKEKDTLFSAKQYTLPDGQSYVVAGLYTQKRVPPPAFDPGPPPPEFDAHRPPPPYWDGEISPPAKMGPEMGNPAIRNTIVQTVILISIASLACYILARSFSSPINRLRKASQQIATGDLSTRVGHIPGKTGSEISDLAKDFDNMAERMEKMINLQKRLLVDISHELRSPLARINVALELAKKKDSCKTGAMLEKIEKESMQLNHLIGQLLTLFRMENSEERFPKKPVELSPILRDIAENVTFEVEAQSKSVIITKLTDITLDGSEELLRRAIENIIRNAAHYTAEDTTVEISSTILEKGSRSELIIKVRDYGPGIPEAELQSVLKPFYRVSNSRNRKSGGQGIGLSIAKQAIKEHGGSISIANIDNKQGLEVSITLPIRPIRSSL